MLSGPARPDCLIFVKHYVPHKYINIVYLWDIRHIHKVDIYILIWICVHIYANIYIYIYVNYKLANNNSLNIIIIYILIWNKNQKMRTFLNWNWLSFRSNRLIRSHREIYKHRRNCIYFIDKLDFMSVMFPTLSKLEMWNKVTANPRTRS